MLLTYSEDFIYINIHGVTYVFGRLYIYKYTFICGVTYVFGRLYIYKYTWCYLPKKNLPTLRIRPNPKIKSRGKTLDNNRETRPQDSPFVLGTDTTRNKEEKDRA